MNESDRSDHNPRLHISITPASLQQKPILANLLELYSHDFSSFVDLEIGPDGRFGYEGLDSYWAHADRHPFLIYVANKLAGFVLIDGLPGAQPNDPTWD